MEMIQGGAKTELMDFIIKNLSVIEAYHKGEKNELDGRRYSSIIDMCDLVVKWKRVILTKSKFEEAKESMNRAKMLSQSINATEVFQEEIIAPTGNKFNPIRKFFQIALEASNRISYKLRGVQTNAKKSGMILSMPSQKEEIFRSPNFMITEKSKEYDLMRYVAVHFKSSGILNQVTSALRKASDFYSKIGAEDPNSFLDVLDRLPKSLESMKSSLINSRQQDTEDSMKIEIENLLNKLDNFDSAKVESVILSESVKIGLSKMKQWIPNETVDGESEFAVIRDNLKAALSSFEHVSHEGPIEALRSAVFTMLDDVPEVEVKQAITTRFSNLSFVDRLYEDKDKAFDEHISLMEGMSRSELQLFLPGAFQKLDEVTASPISGKVAEDHLLLVVTAVKNYFTTISDTSYLPEEDENEVVWMKPSQLHTTDLIDPPPRRRLRQSPAPISMVDSLLTLAKTGLNFRFNFALHIDDLKDTIWDDVDTDEQVSPTGLNEALLRRKFFDEPATRRQPSRSPMKDGASVSDDMEGGNQVGANGVEQAANGGGPNAPKMGGPPMGGPPSPIMADNSCFRVGATEKFSLTSRVRERFKSLFGLAQKKGESRPAEEEVKKPKPALNELYILQILQHVYLYI